MPSVTAEDALLFTVAKYLLNFNGRAWRKVYQRRAPEEAPSNTKVWVVIRVLDARIGRSRADRDSAEIDLAVQAISEEGDPPEKAANVIVDALHLSGINDSRRANTNLPAHADWHFLCVERQRATRLLTPVRQGKKPFYENGYVFRVSMESKTQYS